MRRRKVYLGETRRQAVLRVLAGEEVSAVASALGLKRGRLYDWCKRARRDGLEGLRGPGRPAQRVVPSELLEDEGRAARRKIAELERQIGEQQADLDFFRQALRHVKARQQAAVVSGGLGSTKSSGR